MIRRARAQDADRVAEIWNRVIRETTQTFTTVEKDPRVLAASVEAAPFFVAENDGEVVGFVTYGQFRDGPGYRHTAEHSVHLSAAARGRGLGRALMNTAETHARSAGIHSMLAGIAGENPDAVAFHRAIGFVQRAVLPRVGYKFGRWHDLILMQKFL